MGRTFFKWVLQNYPKKTQGNIWVILSQSILSPYSAFGNEKLPHFLTVKLSDIKTTLLIHCRQSKKWFFLLQICLKTRSSKVIFGNRDTSDRVISDSWPQLELFCHFQSMLTSRRRHRRHRRFKWIKTWLSMSFILKPSVGIACKLANSGVACSDKITAQAAVIYGRNLRSQDAQYAGNRFLPLSHWLLRSFSSHLADSHPTLFLSLSPFLSLSQFPNFTDTYAHTRAHVLYFFAE